jgi:hypothetical protein
MHCGVPLCGWCEHGARARACVCVCSYDQCDVCGGNGQSCLDCKGVANGPNKYDICHVCGGDGSTCHDCNGVAGGNSRYDQCDVCGGNSQSCLDCKGVVNGPNAYDACDVCGGNGQECRDCTGAIFGTTTYDACDVCGGNGEACAPVSALLRSVRLSRARAQVDCTTSDSGTLDSETYDGNQLTMRAIKRRLTELHRIERELRHSMHSLKHRCDNDDDDDNDREHGLGGAFDANRRHMRHDDRERWEADRRAESDWMREGRRWRHSEGSADESSYRKRAPPLSTSAPAASAATTAASVLAQPHMMTTQPRSHQWHDVILDPLVAGVFRREGEHARSHYSDDAPSDTDDACRMLNLRRRDFGRLHASFKTWFALQAERERVPCRESVREYWSSSSSSSSSESESRDAGHYRVHRPTRTHVTATIAPATVDPLPGQRQWKK